MNLLKTFLFIFFLLSKTNVCGQMLINEVMASNIDCFLSPATNFDGWIEVYNYSDNDFPLSGCYISDEIQSPQKWQFPSAMPDVPSKGYFVIWFDSNEVSTHQPPFKLDVDGGYIGIYSRNGDLICEMNYPEAIQRTSFAKIGSTEDWGYAIYPSPGTANGEIGFCNKQLENPQVDNESSFFLDRIDVNVSIPNGSTLKYTLDGTSPSQSNGKISNTGIFHIEETTNLRLRLFQDGYIPSNVVTKTYIKKEYSYNLPSISIVTDNDFLYDDSIGVMVEGKNGKIAYGSKYPCNWNMEWERPVSFSYFDENDHFKYSSDVNLEISGKYSRRFTPKSFKLKGNKKFGNKTLNYPFFDQKPYIRNRTILLRNGGNDNQCRIKDAIFSTIIQRSGIDVDLQSYQPVAHYINGVFSGLINMREPNNKHFVFANYGYDDEEIDMFETYAKWIVLLGDDEKLDELCNLSQHCTDEVIFKQIGKHIDLDELANYMAIRLYLGSDDWPHNNCKGFRAREEDGKFRLILFDMDNSFKMNNMFKWFIQTYEAYKDNHQELKIVTVFLNLLQNESYRRKFVDTFCVVGGSVFEPKNCSKIVDELSQKVEPILAIENISPWETAQAIKDSLKFRNEKMIKELVSFENVKLKGQNPSKYSISSNIANAHLYIDDIEIPNNYFDGYLYPGFIISVKEPYGYEFDYWKNAEDNSILTYNSILNDPSTPLNLVAIFKKKEKSKTPQSVIVNELSASNHQYVNDYFKRADWIELYNSTSKEVNLEGYYISNNKYDLHMYRINGDNNNTIIPAYGYKVLWCDKKESLSQLHIPFKLSSSGGSVYLTSPNDEYTSKLDYTTHDPSKTVGRYPDGSDNVYYMNVPSIGKSNKYSSYLGNNQLFSTDIQPITEDKNDSSIMYSNGEIIFYARSNCNLYICDLSGKNRYIKKNIRGFCRYNIENLRKGFYFVKIAYDKGGEIVSKIEIK